MIVWYAGLPFDPSYGLAAIRHLDAPDRHPAPSALDHAAIGLSVYRKGATAAYALNRYSADQFHHRAAPFAVAVARSRVERDGGSYRLHVETPERDGKRTILADLTFTPAPATQPIERDLGGGGPAGPHHWILAAADCRVDGTVALDGRGGFSLDFRGRGYHDHNAGALEMSRALRRWRWGRVHLGRRTHVYYHAEPRHGVSSTLWITCEDGRPVSVRDDVTIALDEPKRHPLGIGYARSLSIAGADASWRHAATVDYGPFYLRWLTEFRVGGETGVGIAELLDGDRLHRPWFNWMIPYRLKSPRR